MKPDLQKQRKTAFLFDFILLTLLSIVGEFFAQKGLDFFSTPFSFSIAALPLFVLLFRWGLKGLPSLFVLGFFNSFLLKEATFQTYLVNISGYPGLALGMLLFIKPGREEMKLSFHVAALYIFIGFLGMIIIRSVILTLFEADIASNLLVMGSNEALSYIGTSLIFVLLRNKKEFLIYLPAIYEAAEKDKN